MSDNVLLALAFVVLLAVYIRYGPHSRKARLRKAAQESAPAASGVTPPAAALPADPAARLMQGIGFTASDLEANRKGVITPGQMGRIKQQLQRLEGGGQSGKASRAGLILAGYAVIVLVMIPLVVEGVGNSNVAQIPVRVVALVIGLYLALLVTVGLLNRRRWGELGRTMAGGKIPIKTLTSRLEPIKEEAFSDTDAVNRLMPDAARNKRSPWLYYVRMGRHTHILDHDPARTYEHGVQYRLYYVGNEYCPLVLSAEPVIPAK